MMPDNSEPAIVPRVGPPKIADQLLDAISVPIERVERRGTYSVRMFWALLVMLAMILVYGGSVLALLLGIFFLVTSGLASLTRNPVFAVLLVGVPLLVAVCVLVALVKPLFARRDQGLDDFELQPAHEPLLFEFISRLCHSVGAPAPASIVVDTNVNAGASFIKGIFDRPLRLTLGLPLVLGLDTRQLAGVIAHELGRLTSV